MGDLHERIDRTFQECEECGGYFVNVGSHECGDGAVEDPRREERMQRADTDARPDAEQVAILPTRNVDGSYAYHEVDTHGRPRCGGGGSRDDDAWTLVSRGEAKDRGKAPCLTCRRLGYV